MIDFLKKIFLRMLTKDDKKKEILLIAKRTREIIKVEKRFSKPSVRTRFPEMFKMLELSLKYGVPVKRIEQNGRYFWIIEVEE
ncbi:MAG: hypothetical protein DRJ38_01625 [Thermoprotei archaeon]|nr:MAG: hypothetical protein DRJ38_01625 [Thermoprotei archaeon]